LNAADSSSRLRFFVSCPNLSRTLFLAGNRYSPRNKISFSPHRFFLQAGKIFGMYQVTPESVQRIRNEGYDVWTISLWERWLELAEEFQAAIKKFREAFENVSLGDGVGMREADGRDSYANKHELASLRELDRGSRWQGFSADDLNQYYCSFGHADSQGKVFLLPAYLLCDLNDKHQFGFTENLIDGLAKRRLSRPGWVNLLNCRQSPALCRLLELLKHYPDNHSRGEQIDMAIATLTHVEVVEIRAGDSMETVSALLKQWLAWKHVSSFCAFLPIGKDHPFDNLLTYSLPSGLVVDFHFKGEELTYMSQRLPAESNENPGSTRKFIGLRYDGDWSLI
jgi:hypothetical protein